jgi:molecular chaperone GrpE
LLKNLMEGVEMTKREFMSVFERNGIKRIYPAVGEFFDHNIHQAVAHIPDSDNPEGSVVQVLQAGYSIKDRLLRPAMVGVAKAVE